MLSTQKKETDKVHNIHLKRHIQNIRKKIG